MIISDLYIISDLKEKEELYSLAPSSKFILYLLKQYGPMNRQKILKETLLPNRTVAYSLRKLKDSHFIRSYKDDDDKRISIFEATI
ncbi:MAG: MarR family transcriptional regulator [Promethearchaeia archaeon]